MTAITKNQVEILDALAKHDLPACRLAVRFGRRIEAIYRDLVHLESTGAVYVWVRSQEYQNLWCLGVAA